MQCGKQRENGAQNTELSANVNGVAKYLLQITAITGEHIVRLNVMK